MAYSNTRYKYGFGYTPPKPPPTQPTLNPTAAGPETYGVNLSGTNTQGVLPVNQSLANAYSAIHPEWQPPDAVNAQLANPISPVTFNPYNDPNFLLGAAGIEQSGILSQGAFDYGTGTQGPQNFGYDPDLRDVPNDPNDPSKGTHKEYTGAIHLQSASEFGYNPYNQAAVLQRSYDNTQRGTTNSYAAQGQLYSGALLNQRSTDTYNYNRSSDSVQRSAADFYQGLQTNVDATKNGPITKLLLNSLPTFLKTQQGS